jgi:hypothetical protein
VNLDSEETKTGLAVAGWAIVAGIFIGFLMRGNKNEDRTGK